MKTLKKNTLQFVATISTLFQFSTIFILALEKWAYSIPVMLVSCGLLIYLVKRWKYFTSTDAIITLYTDKGVEIGKQDVRPLWRRVCYWMTYTIYVFGGSAVMMWICSTFMV